MAQHKFEAFCHCAITSNRIGAHTDTDHTVPYGTALWGGAIPRHFVPGYDRAVPLGHFATASLVFLFAGKTFSHEGVHLSEPGVREFLCQF
ncbi:MAG: hypothetical protein JO232_18870 [Verrucomicrobia bacterium]|nr:hypothetical protein [Verrucomicrobiota bacterium]